MGGRLAAGIELGCCGIGSAELGNRDPPPPPPGIGPCIKSPWLPCSGFPCDRPRGVVRAGWGRSKGVVNPELNKSTKSCSAPEAEVKLACSWVAARYPGPKEICIPVESDAARVVVDSVSCRETGNSVI